MITLEDKLDIFYKIVLKDEEGKCKETLEQLEEKNKSIIKEKKENLEIKKKDIINRKIQLAETERNEMLSRFKQDNKEKLLSKRQEILKSLISSLEERERQFTSSKEYRDYFITYLDKTLDEMEENEIILGIRKADGDNFNEEILSLGNKKGINIVIDTIKEDIIGGFVISDKDRTYSLDYSFKTIIEENKYLIGKTLYTLINETGDSFE